MHSKPCVCVCLCVLVRERENKCIDIWTVLQNLCVGKLLLVRMDDDLAIIARLREPVETRLSWSTASRQGGISREVADLTEQNRKTVIKSDVIIVSPLSG